MEAQKIFIVEDDRDIASLLWDYLNRYGFKAIVCRDFTDVSGEFEKADPQLVLLDINLPAFDGFYWCGKIRTKSSCPILFISSRNADSDQVFAMMNGGDDYITKPFSYEVLIAKINAHLRRAYGAYAQAEKDELACGDCSFSKSRLMLLCNEKNMELSKTEAGVIRLLFQAYPKVAAREQLLNEIWDDDAFVDENTLNVTISRIRKKIAAVGSKLEIKPVRGVGYRIGGSGHEK